MSQLSRISPFLFPMKTQTPPRFRALTSLLVLALSSLAHPSASAATLTFSTTAPTPGANDIYNLTGAANDGANVRDGGTYADGAGNDAFTYVANDRTNRREPRRLRRRRRLAPARRLHEQHQSHLV